MSWLTPIADLVRSKPLPVLCCIIGLPGSGKSTLSHQLATALEPETCLQVSSDDFYLPQAARQQKNIDWRGQPGSTDKELFNHFIQNFAAGRSLQIPRYNFATDDRLCELETIPSANICLFDGWMAGLLLQETCNWQPNCSLVTVYIDIAEAAAKRGRFRREAEQGVGLSSSDLEHFWSQVILPNIPEYVYKYRRYADFIVQRDNEQSVGTIIQQKKSDSTLDV